MSAQLTSQAPHQLAQSAVAYATVDVSASDYEPTTPFKGLQIGTGGDLEITGLDGVKVTMSNVEQGVHAFAGKSLHTANTTATGITALF